MKTGTIITVFMVALILAALFAIGGAGLYGSPFGPGGTSGEYTVYAAAISVGPLAGLVALIFHRRLPQLAGLALLLGAVAGVCIGLLVESKFRGYWGKVFAVVVWLPMSIVGARMLMRRSQS